MVRVSGTVFFFKQKTAYEMRISDWSSDVCSSDLRGAISATTESDGDALLANNFRLSKIFWDHCTQEQIPLIYASSAATYGDGAAGFDDDADREHLARLRPLNGYGWSKNLFDRWVARRVAEKAASDGAGTPPQWAGLKFFNVYGPNEYHKGGQAKGGNG